MAIFKASSRQSIAGSVGGEIERLKRAVDAHWSEHYLAAGSLAEREAVLMAERGMRFEPKDWIE